VQEINNLTYGGFAKPNSILTALLSEGEDSGSFLWLWDKSSEPLQAILE
jgi:hypothetical protein